MLFPISRIIINAMQKLTTLTTERRLDGHSIFKNSNLGTNHIGCQRKTVYVLFRKKIQTRKRQRKTRDSNLTI